MTPSEASNWDCPSLLDVDGGRFDVKNTGYHWLGYGVGTATLRVRNGGTYEQRTSDVDSSVYALNVALQTRVARGVVEVDGAGSTLIADRLNCARGCSRVTVKNGGTLAVQSPTRDQVRIKTKLGGVLQIDGGTLCSSTNGAEAEWFPFGERHTVGANGGSVTTPSVASLGGWLSGSGTLTKNGTGHVSLMPSAAPVHVAEGSVGFHVVSQNADDAACLVNATGTVTVASGAEVRACGPAAFGDMTLQAGDGAYAFGTVGEDHAADQGAWAMVNAAHLRTDGWFALTDARVQNKAGATWRTAKMAVNRSFEISVDYYVTKLSGATYVPFGVAMVWQNDGTNVQKLASGNWRALGYANETAKGKWANSFALGFDAAGSAIRVSHYDGNKGYFLGGESDAEQYRVNAMTGSSFAHPVTLVAKYDYPNRKMTFTVRSGNGKAWTQEVADLDLAAKCGADEAYFGLTAADWSVTGCQGEHFVGNIRLSTETPAAETSVGGTASVAAQQTFNAKLSVDSFNTRWSMARAAYADGATLNVTGPTNATLRFGVASGAGRLAKTGAAALALGLRQGTLPGTLELADGSLALDGLSTEDLTHDARSYWQLSSPDGGSVTNEDAIGIGRAISKKEVYTDILTLRDPLDITKKWTLSWHGKFHAVSAYACRYMSVTLHNDARGAAACGTDYGATLGLTNSVTVAWQAKSADLYGTGKVGLRQGAEGTLVGVEEDYTSKINMMIGSSTQGKSAFADREVDFSLAYDPATTTLTFTMRQGESVFTLTPQQIDLSQVVGNRAYLAFGVSTINWFSVNHLISDLRFAYDASESVPYVNRLELRAGVNPVTLNAATAGEKFDLAGTLIAPDGATLALSSADEEAVATADRVECAGTLTLNGGTFQIGETTLSDVRKLNLANDARLNVPAGVQIRLPRLLKDSVRVPPGAYTSENSSFVTGGGKILVGSGMAIIIR